jgi:hypothetical protein
VTLFVAISMPGLFTPWNRALGFHFEDGRYSRTVEVKDQYFYLESKPVWQNNGRYFYWPVTIYNSPLRTVFVICTVLTLQKFLLFAVSYEFVWVRRQMFSYNGIIFPPFAIWCTSYNIRCWYHVGRHECCDLP